MARAKRAALKDSTASSDAPSRRCRCQSSGRRMTSVLMRHAPVALAPARSAAERRRARREHWHSLALPDAARHHYSFYREPADHARGEHRSSYASSATLYEVGFNHFWRAPSEQHPGDLVFIQGHSSPGIYARAYLEGRLTEEQLRHFRQEAGGPGTGLSSYPHPWLMPDFWQFPTVSMGLGPMMAIFQAR